MTIAKAIKRAQLRSGRNYDTRSASQFSGIDVSKGEPSRVVQSEKDNADINVIVKRFGVTRALPQSVRVPMYGDFTGVMDYHSAMGAIRLAEESFMAMPSSLRNRFENDPQQFLDFCADPKNMDEMRKLGLAVPAKDDIIPVKASDNPPPKPEKVNEQRSTDEGVKRGAKAPDRSGAHPEGE